MIGWSRLICRKRATLLLETAAAEEAERSIAFHFPLKRNFSPWQQTDGHFGLAGRSRVLDAMRQSEA